MAINDVALKSELDNDPTALGYAALINRPDPDWTGVVTLLNAPRSTIKLHNGVQPSYRIVSAINRAEYDALQTAAKNWLSFVIQAGSVNLAPGEVRTALGVLFPVGSVTRANLLALADRDASRAEQLFGEGAVIRFEDAVRASRGVI